MDGLKLHRSAEWTSVVTIPQIWSMGLEFHASPMFLLLRIMTRVVVCIIVEW